MGELFDMTLRAIRRDRAARSGPELFLHERAFEDCLERIALTERHFANALLIGCPDPNWGERIRLFADEVRICDPGPLFADRCGGQVIVEDAWEVPTAAFDLVIAVGTLDTVNDLPLALRLIAHAMCSDGFFLAAVAGGNTLPQLRAAMRAADAISGAAVPHAHPRIEAAALASLLTEAGFARPVIDVDRTFVSYPSLARLVGDLRKMGATNILKARPRFVGRAELNAAAADFRERGNDGRTRELFEILHLAAWKPKER